MKSQKTYIQHIPILNITFLAYHFMWSENVTVIQGINAGLIEAMLITKTTDSYHNHFYKPPTLTAP